MDDINRLVEELHASIDGAETPSGEAIRLIGWLEQVRAGDGVDLLLVSGAPPSVRIDGALRPLEAAPGVLDGIGARQHIRKNALQHMHQEITMTRRNGSFTFEESLARLVKDGLVEREEAFARAVHPEDFESALGG